MPPRMATFIAALLTAAVLLAGCGDQESPAAPAETPSVTVDYPLEGSVFPPEFVPPTFLWHDDHAGANRWNVVVTFTDGGEPLREVSVGPPPPEGEIDTEAIGATNQLYEGTPYQRSAHSWTPSPEIWAEIQDRTVAKPATVAFEGFAAKSPQTIVSRGAVTLTTSEDPVGAPIFYRDVPLMPAVGEDGRIAPLAPNAVPMIAWRLRDVTRPRSKVILTGMPSCANCHSFSRDGNTLGMDVDGPHGDKGAYAIAPLERVTVIGDEQVITWNSFPDKPEGHQTIGFLSQISPDGKFVVSTLNEELYVTNFADYRFLQVFYPTRGIIGWYSTETGEIKALPGADDTDYVHCQPAWSPDGSYLIFARARAFDAYPPGQEDAKYSGDPKEPQIQYDLVRMPFNGGKGGTPVPVEGASANGMSNTFPKISPDGKWLVFTQCKNGQLMRRDGRLRIVSVEGGEAREMNCNTPLMNSWHSFSPNGRWMVFSSKSRTPYTQMFLTHFDENGNDTPAILIPNSTAANRAVNIPEFVNRPYDDFDAIDVPAADHHRRLQEGLGLVAEEKFDEAVEKFRAAVKKEPGFRRALLALGFALLEMGRNEEARPPLIEAIELDSRVPLAHIKLGMTFLNDGRAAEAAPHFARALGIDRDSARAHHNLGLALLQQGKLEPALREVHEAARLEPADPNIRVNLGWILQQAGNRDGAIAEYRKAIEIDPANVQGRVNLVPALTMQGRHAEALEQIEALYAGKPDELQFKLQLAWALATMPKDGLRDGRRAVALAEQVRKTTGDDPAILDALAAAYAEAGRFPDAVKTAARAIEVLKAKGVTNVPELSRRLDAYRSGRPFRQQ